MSLRAKLVLWYTAFFAISGALLTGGLYLLIARTLEAEAEKFLAEEYDEATRITLQSIGDLGQLRARIKPEFLRESYFPLVYRLHDTSAGKDLVALAPEGLEDALSALAAYQVDPGERTRRSVTFGPRRSHLRLLSGPLSPKRHPGILLQVGMHNRWVERRTASLLRYLALVLVGVVLFAAAGGWVLASRSLRPINRIASGLNRIEATDLTTRLSTRGSGDEVDRLRQAINRMLERLKEGFDRLQSFTADAAHELRTPLAALQCHLENTINRPPHEAGAREAIADALKQIVELNVLVDNLLFLARLDAEAGLRNPALVDLCELLHSIGEPFQLLAEQRGVSLAIRCDAGVHTTGDGVLLRRVFGNLFDNAIRYTPEGGTVGASVVAEADGWRITVADTGCGIPPDALPHIFERFYRADESRSRDAGGAGLGLSIVKRAVELHRGRISIESAPGKGTTVTVWLPPSGESRSSARSGTP